MADTTPEPKRRPWIKWVVIAVVLILVIGGAGAGVMVWQRSRAGSHPAAEAPAVAPSGVIPLESFLVNLADKDAQRFARVTMRLVVDTKEEAATLTADPVRQARLRSTVLEILAVQTADRMVTPDGKTELKKAIAERGSSVLGKQVRDVLFTDFVVQ